MTGTSSSDEIRPTPIDELRKPHPEQSEIDALSANVLKGRAPTVGIEYGTLRDFEDAQADQDSREGWASDDCAYDG